MFAHTTLVSIPFVSIAAVAILIVIGVAEQTLRDKDHWILANWAKIAIPFALLIEAIIVTSVIKNEYLYIRKPVVAFAVISDLIIIIVGGYSGWEGMMKPYLLDKTGKHSLVAPVAYAFVVGLFGIHLFFIGACAFHWDWAFRPFVGQDTLDRIAIMREDDSINRADREEQDYWNQHANTIQD